MKGSRKQLIRILGFGAASFVIGVSPVQAEPLSEADTGWKDLISANVINYANIRQEGSIDSAVVGRIYSGQAARIIERGQEWTKVESGDVVGYIRNDLFLEGEDAKALYKALHGIAESYGEIKALASRIEDVHSEKEKVYESAAYTDEDMDEQLGYLGYYEEPTDYAVYDDEYNKDIQNGYDGYSETAAPDAGYDDGSSNMGYSDAPKEYYEEPSYEEPDNSEPETSGSDTSYNEDTSYQSYASGDLELLAALIQCEAGGESYDGMIAVGAVVMNRVASPSFPGSISGVIYESGQFTPAYSGALDSVLASGARSDCRQAAQDAMNGANNIGGCLYFNAGYGQGIQIGNQHFY